MGGGGVGEERRGCTAPGQVIDVTLHTFTEAWCNWCLTFFFFSLSTACCFLVGVVSSDGAAAAAAAAAVVGTSQ